MRRVLREASTAVNVYARFQVFFWRGGEFDDDDADHTIGS